MDTRPKSSGFAQISRYLLPAFVVLLGMQLLRTLIPSMSWYLRDTRGLGSMQLIPYAFGTFFLGYLAAILRRIFGPHGSLWLTAGGVGLVRIIEQFNHDPGIDLWLSIVGVGLFLNFLPIFIGHTRAHGEGDSYRWLFGVILGLALDIALRGVFGVVDLNSVGGSLPDVVIVLLSVVLVVLIWREEIPERTADTGTGFVRALPLLAIGLALMLQGMFFGSQGYIEQVGGLKPPMGSIIVMVGLALLAAGATWGAAMPRALHPLSALAMAVFLAYTVFQLDQLSTWIVPVIFGGQFLLGWGLSGVSQVNSKAYSPGLGWTTFMHASGMLLFLILIFGFYLGQDMSLPFPRITFPAAGAGLLGLSFLVASVPLRKSSQTSRRETAGLILVGLFVLVPIIDWLISGSDPPPLQPPGGTVKIMTYNIHSGFDSFGRNDLEAIAEVIEESGADIVALQEVSRVRLMDGGADIPLWLSNRLEMPFIFRGTEEPHWGNAILSRYPILETGWGDLPREDTLIGRGFLWSRIDVGSSDPLLVINTHLHHLEPDSQARQMQVLALLDFWNGRDKSILVGDLNAEPGSPEMRMLAEEGLQDTWNIATSGEGFTFLSSSPVKRIDWIWHSEDLIPLEIKVVQTLASDHMPVLAEFEIGG